MSKKSKRPKQPQAASVNSKQNLSKTQENGEPLAVRQAMGDRISLLLEYVVKHYLKGHLWTTLASIVALVVMSFFYFNAPQPQCIDAPDTPIGPIHINCSSPEARLAEKVVDGLHGNIYSDRSGGFALRLENADQWSIIQPDESADGRKFLVFPPGILGGDIPVTYIIPEVSAVFVNKGLAQGGIASAWIFRIPSRTDSIEKFIAEETKYMRRTSTIVAIFALAQAMQGSPASPESMRDAETITRSPEDDRVRLTNMQVAPNRKDALLIWEAPFKGVPADVIGRVVVGERNTYYIVTLKLRSSRSEEGSINIDLRTLLSSFQMI